MDVLWLVAILVLVEHLLHQESRLWLEVWAADVATGFGDLVEVALPLLLSDLIKEGDELLLATFFDGPSEVRVALLRCDNPLLNGLLDESVLSSPDVRVVLHSVLERV